MSDDDAYDGVDKDKAAIDEANGDDLSDEDDFGDVRVSNRLDMEVARDNNTSILMRRRSIGSNDDHRVPHLNSREI
jgi:hypothetical protein